MVEVKVPKNIMVYETKVAGPFTTKQLVCVIITVLFDLLLYNAVLKPLNVSVELLFYSIAFLDVPILAFGYYKPMGLPLDKYLRMIYHSVILAPTKRLNKKTMIEKPKKGKENPSKIKKSHKYKAYQ